MRGVLNRATKTVHKNKIGGSGLEARCGATNRIDPDRLGMTSIERAIDRYGAEKCGRCFEDGGGY